MMATFNYTSPGIGYYDRRYVKITGDTITGDLNVCGSFTNYNTESDDMGRVQDSDLRGYGFSYVTDKTLSNCRIGSNSETDNGAIRVNINNDPNTFEIYLRGAWNYVLYDLTYIYDDFRHTPLTNQIYVWSGNSVLVGLNNRPITEEYDTSMGAYPPPKTIDGGTF